MRRLKIDFCLSLLCLAGIAAQSISDLGGHFRSATIYWQQVPDPTANVVNITIRSAWRRSYSSNYFQAAQNPSGDTVMKINGRESPSVTFGDGTIQYLEGVTISAYSIVEDWFMGVEVFTHTYPSPTNQGVPWVVHFTGCCQLDSISNTVDSRWDIWATIDLLQADHSPRIVSLPVVYVQSGLPGYFQLLAAGGPGAQGVSWAAAGPAGGVVPGPALQVGADGSVASSARCPDGSVGGCLLALQAYATTGRIQVPVALLVNVTLSLPPTFDPATVPSFNWTVGFFPGFERRVDIKGFLQAPAARSLGFSAGSLPPGARLSPVRGKGSGADAPAIVTLRWNPTRAQMGGDVGCFDVVDSASVASTQKCLSLVVVDEPAPSIALSIEGEPLPLQALPAVKCPTSPCYYLSLFLGTHRRVNVTAYDPNPQDVLSLDAIPPPANPNAPPPTPDQAAAACGAGGAACVPPGAVWWPAAPAAPAGGVGVAVTRALDLTPAYNHGGYLGRHCFLTSDSCGTAAPGSPDPCPGVRQTATVCLWVQVERCRFVVRKGNQLQTIAAVYQTDWLQLWSHNQWLHNPDSDLAPGQVLNIGHDYAVQPLDTPAGVASRFGMTAEALAALNADVAAAPDRPICASTAECADYRWCVLPSSCKGASSSIYSSAQASYSDPAWYPAVLAAGAPAASS